MLGAALIGDAVSGVISGKIVTHKMKQSGALPATNKGRSPIKSRATCKQCMHKPGM